MTRTRQAAVAGSFYPADAKQLREAVQRFLGEAKPDPEGPPKAIIAPHAGYMYSGPVAASAYAQLKASADDITRVVLLGPSHRVPFRGLATTSADSYTTPLGQIAIDRHAVESLGDLPFVQELDEAHLFEHSLEVQLPFLQEVLTSFSLVPLIVGDASPQQVATVLERLWGGKETLVVISSDLSHYHDYATAQRLDHATSRALEDLDDMAIGPEAACGRVPVRGLLHLARQHQLHCKTLDQRNSGDTAGPRDQVVGYGAYVFH